MSNIVQKHSPNPVRPNDKTAKANQAQNYFLTKGKANFDKAFAPQTSILAKDWRVLEFDSKRDLQNALGLNKKAIMHSFPNTKWDDEWSKEFYSIEKTHQGKDGAFLMVYFLCVNWIIHGRWAIYTSDKIVFQFCPDNKLTAMIGYHRKEANKGFAGKLPINNLDGKESAMPEYHRNQDIAYIEKLRVDPEFKRLGLGEFMMSMIERTAGGYGYSKFQMEVLNGNEPMIKIALKLGYHAAGESEYSGTVWTIFEKVT